MGTFVSDFLQSIFALGGGLLTTMSITEWIFDNTDPLLALIAPDQSDTSFFNNNEKSIITMKICLST